MMGSVARAGNLSITPEGSALRSAGTMGALVRSAMRMSQLVQMCVTAARDAECVPVEKSEVAPPGADRHEGRLGRRLCPGRAQRSERSVRVPAGDEDEPVNAVPDDEERWSN